MKNIQGKYNGKYSMFVLGLPYYTSGLHIFVKKILWHSSCNFGDTELVFYFHPFINHQILTFLLVYYIENMLLFLQEHASRENNKSQMMLRVLKVTIHVVYFLQMV